MVPLQLHQHCVRHRSVSGTGCAGCAEFYRLSPFTACNSDGNQSSGWPFSLCVNLWECAEALC